MIDFNNFIIHSNLTNWGHVWHIVTNDGKGMITIEYDNDEPDLMFFYGLSVCNDVRNQGIGKALLSAAEKLGLENGKHRFKLHIEKPKSWLYDFYIKQGYSYADEDEDEIFLVKSIIK